MAKKKAKARSKSQQKRIDVQERDRLPADSADAEDAGLEAGAEDYLDPSALAPPADEGVVVVADFDPTNPGQELDEPTKVIRPNDRLARKAEQRQNLEK